MSRLGGWEGYVVKGDWIERRAGQTVCVIRLEAVRGWPRCCSGCGELTAAIHDLQERQVRDLPLFEHCVELIVPRVRVACSHCGPMLEQLAWLAPFARVKQRLAESAGRLCAVMDMNAGQVLEVRRHCPNAAIVFDLFHVVAKYGREVIARVRVYRASEPRNDRRGRRVVKGARWLLLNNRDSLRPGDDVQLGELLAATATRSSSMCFAMP